MTSFQDGPAKDKRLMLRRAPIFLRVTEERRGDQGQTIFDALNEPDDSARAGETLYAYVMVEAPGHMHMRCGGKSKSASGFYPIAVYRLIDPQPDDATMRHNAKWIDWCAANTALIPFRWNQMKG